MIAMSVAKSSRYEAHTSHSGLRQFSKWLSMLRERGLAFDMASAVLN